MSDQPAVLSCANCGQILEATDRFCRECGLPTLRQAARPRVPAAPPDTAELQRALEAQPEVTAFIRDEGPTEAAPPPAETTGDVLRATSPTQAVQMAASTMMMLVGLMVVLAVAGVILLVLALK